MRARTWTLALGLAVAGVGSADAQTTTTTTTQPPAAQPAQPPPAPTVNNQQVTIQPAPAPAPPPAQVYVQPAPAVVAAPAPVAVVAPAPAGPPVFDRFSLIYSPEVELSNDPLGHAINKAAAGDGVHNIGLETSTQTGFFARYHAQLDFTYAYGLNGIRLEPLGFSWALPVVRTNDFSFEIEPLISLADGMILFSNDTNNDSNVTFLLGSGAEVQANLAMGPLYLFASPVGIELRWLEATSGAGGGTYGGSEWLWRFRAGVGFQY